MLELDVASSLDDVELEIGVDDGACEILADELIDGELLVGIVLLLVGTSSWSWEVLIAAEELIERELLVGSVLLLVGTLSWEVVVLTEELIEGELLLGSVLLLMGTSSEVLLGNLLLDRMPLEVVVRLSREVTVPGFCEMVTGLKLYEEFGISSLLDDISLED